MDQFIRICIIMCLLGGVVLLTGSAALYVPPTVAVGGEAGCMHIEEGGIVCVKAVLEGRHAALAAALPLSLVLLLMLLISLVLGCLVWRMPRRQANATIQTTIRRPAMREPGSLPPSPLVALFARGILHPRIP